MPGVSQKPPQMIPVGEHHRLRVDHAAKTVKLESAASLADLAKLTPDQLAKLDAEAEQFSKFWITLGYKRVR